MDWLLGSVAIGFSLWIVAQDPTIQTLRRRVRFDAEIPASSNEENPQELVVVVPAVTTVPPRRRRSRK